MSWEESLIAYMVDLRDALWVLFVLMSASFNVYNSSFQYNIVLNIVETS